jgi:malate synthase A
MSRRQLPSIEIADPPSGDEALFEAIFSPAARDFLALLVRHFDAAVDELHQRRQLSRLHMDMTGSRPTFEHNNDDNQASTSVPADWRIRPLPPRLRRRHIDLGDVSPADTAHLVASLGCSGADGVQVDFDDGHCPTWHNQLLGWHNIRLAVSGDLPGCPPLADAPVLMLRPRAWNMTEQRVVVGGRAAPGPLVDFALLMFHVGRPLYEAGAGPFFYLSKLEGRAEARLWRDVFVFVEAELGLPLGAVRACVLIENVMAAFQLEGILWELRDHTAGLNCGLWDYSASIIGRFGQRPEFLLPDRKKYVNMERPFLAAYLRLVVATAASRGAPATGGMAAVVLDTADEALKGEQVAAVLAAKRKEVEAGVAGFLVYDRGLVEPARQLWAEYDGWQAACGDPRSISADDLLTLPKEKMKLYQKNLIITITFTA